MPDIGPQGRIVGTGLIIVVTIFPVWSTVVNLSGVGSFTPNKIRMVNMSGSALGATPTAIRLLVSYSLAGAALTDVHDVLDPNIEPGLVLDGERMVGKVVRLTLPVGALTTCECYVTVTA